MKNKNGRIIAIENEIHVLRSLHRFGWLRTQDIAALRWQQWATSPRPEGPSLAPSAPTASGLRMAQKTLRRMRDKRLVISAQAPDGAVIYALSESGARHLQQMGITAISGKDLMRSYSSSNYRHRCIANQIAVTAIVEGFRTSTEREISQNLWLGGELGIAGKKPDVLLRAGNEIWWCEVERSRKNGKDYARLLNWLDAVRCDAARPGDSKLLSSNLRWSKVIFVCTRTFKSKLMRDLAKLGWPRSAIELFIIFETELYKIEDMLFC